MQTIHLAQTIGRFVAWTSAVLLVSGSIGLAAPAVAERSSTGEARSAHGQAQKQANLQQDQVRDHGRPTARAGDGGRADGSLPRPNDFRAQADPDGLENGGVDQPGGQGGVDVTAQDGNNGTGNDSDCEDDNNGLGTPGHCRPAPAPVAPAVGAGAPSVGIVAVLPALEVVETEVGVLGPSAVAHQAFAEPAAAPAVLPNTGADATMVGVALAALATLTVGAGLVRRGRRETAATG